MAMHDAKARNTTNSFLTFDYIAPGHMVAGDICAYRSGSDQVSGRRHPARGVGVAIRFNPAKMIRLHFPNPQAGNR